MAQKLYAKILDDEFTIFEKLFETEAEAKAFVLGAQEMYEAAGLGDVCPLTAIVDDKESPEESDEIS